MRSQKIAIICEHAVRKPRKKVRFFRFLKIVKAVLELHASASTCLRQTADVQRFFQRGLEVREPQDALAFKNCFERWFTAANFLNRLA